MSSPPGAALAAHPSGHHRAPHRRRASRGDAASGSHDPGALRGYLGLGRKLYRAGHRRAGLAAFPFFLLREALWVYGWLQAKAAYLRTAQGDRDFLYKIVAAKGLTETPTSPRFIEDHSGTDTSQWPEEWQLKADWPYIRQNVADFIRRCYENDAVFQSPLLEIGASGQNDYLGERYELITSNLAYNRQNTAIPLDMEDMAGFADNSIGSILCSEVIEHVKHPDRALAEAFRVLKPGGKLVLTTPYAIVIHNTPEDGGFHGRNFTPQGLELGLVEAGFKIQPPARILGRMLTRSVLMPFKVWSPSI